MKPKRALLAAVLAAGCGTDVADPSASLLSCVFADARPLQRGEVWQVRGEGHQRVCLESAEDAAYVYIPFLAGRAAASGEDPVRLRVEISGGGFVAPDPPAAPAGAVVALDDAPAPLRLDAAFHERLRRREVEELEPRLRPSPSVRAGPGRGPEPSSGPASVRFPAGNPRAAGSVPEPGALLDFNVAISCTREDVRTGRVAFVAEHALVVADTANPVSLAAADYAFFGTAFDTLVHPVLTAHFGEPSDIDGNARAIIFFTRAVNELTPHDAEALTAGFFWSGDLFPATDTDRAEACPAANQAEMFYMLAPDPDAEAGPVVTVSRLRELAVSVIGHEYQHLINASRRLWVNDAMAFEESWLNEGLSHIAEELLFYAAAGLGPRRDLTADEVRAAPGGVAAFNRYMAGNFTNLSRFLARPDTASLMGRDHLGNRGATWAFLRYAADRTGSGDAAFFHALVNARSTGVANLDAVLTAPALDRMQDWTVSVLADDRISGLDPRFRQPSWNVPDIYRETLGEYPLRSPVVEPGQVLGVDLYAGGTAFAEFALEAGGRGAVHVVAGGGGPPGNLRGSFVRIR